MQVDTLAPDLPAIRALRANPARELDRWLQACGIATETVPLVRTAVRLIDAQPTELEVRTVIESIGCSASTLYRRFTSAVGVSPKRYLAIRRHRQFTDALLDRVGADPIALIAAANGYCDQAHASREFRRHTGMSTREFVNVFDGIARMMAVPARMGLDR